LSICISSKNRNSYKLALTVESFDCLADKSYRVGLK